MENQAESHEILNLEANKPMLPISAVAEILQVHQRTLRIYDEENILVPSRSPKNRRLYSLNDVEKGRFIQYLTRELRINLSGIKIISHLLVQLNIDTIDYVGYINRIAPKPAAPEKKQKNRNKLSKKIKVSSKA